MLYDMEQANVQLSCALSGWCRVQFLRQFYNAWTFSRFLFSIGTINMDKSVALKIALQIALMTFQHNTANAGPSWDFNLEHTILAPHGSYRLPGAINTFGTEQQHIRVIKSFSLCCREYSMLIVFVALPIVTFVFIRTNRHSVSASRGVA